MSSNWLPPPPPSEPAPPPARVIFARALRLRCPLCGGRPIFLTWFKLCESCPVCGFHLDRNEPGYWLGSYTINLFVTETAFAVFFVAGMFVTWPDVPWNPLLYLSLLVTIVVPFLVFPHTKTLYLAIDLAFRPPEPPDLATPAEPSLVTPRRPKVQ